MAGNEGIPHPIIAMPANNSSYSLYLACGAVAGETAACLMLFLVICLITGCAHGPMMSAIICELAVMMIVLHGEALSAAICAVIRIGAVSFVVTGLIVKRSTIVAGADAVRIIQLDVL